MDPHILIAGRPVHALGRVGELVIAHEFPTDSVGGPASLTFGLLLDKADRPGWLAKGARCDALLGYCPNWAGRVTEVDWDEGTVTAEGVAREGDKPAPLDGSGVLTLIPDTAVDAAISRSAVSWSRPASLSTTAVASDTSGTYESVNALLGAWAQQTATADERLFVDSRRRLLAGNDPTAPTYTLLPGSGELNWASESQATRVLGRWKDAAGTMSTASAGTGSDELLVDLTPRGAMTATQAANVCASILLALSSGGWDGSITVSGDQFAASGVHPAKAAEDCGRGAMFRLLGQRDPRPGRVPVGYLDFIAERGEYRSTDDTVTITPRGMVARDLTTILASFKAEAA